jgi:predicted nucleic acid-binding protein
MAGYFMDTAYYVACADKKDRHHNRAREYATKIIDHGIPMVITTGILLEIGSSLARLRFRSSAARLLESLGSDPLVTIVPVDDALYERGSALFFS